MTGLYVTEHCIDRFIQRVLNQDSKKFLSDARDHIRKMILDAIADEAPLAFTMGEGMHKIEGYDAYVIIRYRRCITIYNENEYIEAKKKTVYSKLHNVYVKGKKVYK